MLCGKQLSGILGLLLCVCFPMGTVAVLLSLVKVAELVGGEEDGKNLV